MDFIDKSKWHTDDKDWIESRKEEWRYIQRILKINENMLAAGRGYLPVHKKFFFKGELPEEYRINGGEVFGGKLPLFVIWYHPDINDAICEAVLENCNQSAAAAGAIVASLDRLFWLCSDKKYDRLYGFMGGREAWAVKYLCSPRAFEIAKNHEWSLTNSMSPNKVVRHVSAGFHCVLNTTSTSPWHPGQYLWDYLIQVFDKIDNELALNNLCEAFKKVIYFDEHYLTAKDDKYAIALKDKLLTEFEQRKDIPEGIRVLWERAKTEGPPKKPR
ncbi:MAG: hypothetical protein PVJ72_16160 [Gammaproteobacteria bacterium]|jgi:hypothetical protein